MQDFISGLKSFSPKSVEGGVNIALPVVLNFCGCLIELKITQSEKGYFICCENDLFLDANESGEFYYNTFNKYDKNYHYGIILKNGMFYKEYDEEYSLTCALNEFIRFFILLDDFIINNNVIGQEEKFIK